MRPATETKTPNDSRKPSWATGYAVLIVLLAAIAIGTAFARAGQNPSGGPSGGATETLPPTYTEQTPTPTYTEQTPTPTNTEGPPPPTSAEKRVGLVDYSEATDSRAPDVARTFNAYFSGINDGDYERTRAVIDPQSPVKPQNSSSWDKFVNDVSTTNDSDIVLHSVSDDPTGTGAVVADVTFRSNQSPGHGPRGSEQETCTDWNLTYTLTEPSQGEFLILTSDGTHTSC